MPMSPSRIRRAVLTGSAALVLALTSAPATLAANPPAPTHPGSLVLVGGGLKEDNTQVYGEIIKRAGGPRAKIGVLTAASIPASQDPDAGNPDACSNSACNGRYYAGLFKRHGAADAQWIPVDLDHLTNADSDAVVAQINSMTGFFFGGGDQYRYVTSLLHGDRHTDSRALAAIRAKLATGSVVAGSSAGAQIAAGADMVTGGDSYQALRDGSTPGYFEDPSRLGYLPQGGFAFLRSGLIDTHTGTSGREGRALRLAADTGHDTVYALDENTALVVDNPGTTAEKLTVRGPQGVTILDLRHAHARTTRAGWSLTGARYSYLTDGDRYDALTALPVPAPGKYPLLPSDRTPVPPNNDAFHSTDNPDGAPYSLRTTARALMSTRAQRTATATTWESAPGFTVTLGKQPWTLAWTRQADTAQTVIGASIDIAPR
ncbi:cyanophycinase [Streptomyces sp. NPDC001436]